ncbi:putative membrane protein [Spathaspora sp. JA1]|nr:putative membrane protein [Spathaspora sp. JA1]
MSSLLYKKFLQKANLDHIVQMGDEAADPYFETIPDNELHFYQRKGTKRKRKMPQYIPKHDLKILDSVKNRAYRLDLQLSMCGLRLGWAGIIGLIPWVGDCIALLFALQLVKKAQEVEGGLPKHIQAEMMANVTLDFGIGLIPFVGDFINILYKCNSRNFIILEKHLIKKYSSMAPVAATGEAITHEKVKPDKSKKTAVPTAAAATAPAKLAEPEAAHTKQETGTYPSTSHHPGPSLPPRDEAVHHPVPPTNVHHPVPPLDEKYIAEKV